MKILNFTKLGWTLLITAVVAVGAVGLAGCGGGNDNPSGGNNTGGSTTHTHTWGAWVVTTPATCSAKGVETRTCTTDTIHKETRDVAQLSGEACVVDPNTVVKGTFTDDRDGQTYKTVKIGEQTWMAENLNAKTAESWCYNNSADSCNKYGRLYTWSAAKSACQSVGWRLPEESDWRRLVEAAGGLSTAGKALRSKTSWESVSGISNDDTYGFSALPGGFRSFDGGFLSAGSFGYWWTASESGSAACRQNILNFVDHVLENYSDKGNGFSVRCIAN